MRCTEETLLDGMFSSLELIKCSSLQNTASIDEHVGMIFNDTAISCLDLHVPNTGFVPMS